MSDDSLKVEDIDVRRRAERERFVDLPFRLAQRHPAWHPGLRRFAIELIDPARNPWWQERRACFLVVRRGRRIVGRAGVVAPGAVPQLPAAATLVFPDFEDDPGAVGMLLDAIARSARAFSAEEIIGPLNPDVHHDVGIQIDAFDRRNAVFMGYQPPYYAHRIEENGFRPLAEFQAWWLDGSASAEDPSVGEIVRRIERSGRIRIRAADPAHFDHELVHFHHLYSASFADHWAFSPPSWDEFRFIAGDLRRLIRRGMALIAELDGVPVGFVLSIPDVYAILPRHPRGRLTPLVAARTFFRWRRMDTVRVMIAGVLPEHRRLGIHLPLLHHLRRHLVGLGFRYAEISWVKKDNRPLQHVLPLLGCRPVKTNRIYAKRLSG